MKHYFARLGNLTNKTVNINSVEVIDTLDLVKEAHTFSEFKDLFESKFLNSFYSPNEFLELAKGLRGSISSEELDIKGYEHIGTDIEMPSTKPVCFGFPIKDGEIIIDKSEISIKVFGVIHKLYIKETECFGGGENVIALAFFDDKFVTQLTVESFKDCWFYLMDINVIDNKLYLTIALSSRRSEKFYLKLCLDYNTESIKLRRADNGEIVHINDYLKYLTEKINTSLSLDEEIEITTNDLVYNQPFIELSYKFSSVRKEILTDVMVAYSKAINKDKIDWGSKYTQNAFKLYARKMKYNENDLRLIYTKLLFLGKDN